MTKAFLELRTHHDLFKKLEWEYECLTSEPTNSYYAYNFFITAWHLLEWEYPDPDGKITRENLRKGTPLLQICEHLAVGAKHFSPTNPKHQSVLGSERIGPWGGSWRNAWGNSWGDYLEISLEGDAATRFGPSISIRELAQHVMQFWRGHLASPARTETST
jgi:hypothetical protein